MPAPSAAVRSSRPASRKDGRSPDTTAGSWSALQRSEPCDRMVAALQAVNGVATADREVWSLTGTPSGELTEAAARVVDELADEIRAAMRGP
jgi:hypothetical protein